MNEFDIPILKKTYELYKEFYVYCKSFPKQDRYVLGQKCEDIIAEILQYLLSASGLPKAEKIPELDKASAKLNLLRVYIRLAKDIRALDNKKYVALQTYIDEIGRMLGGWKKSVKEVEVKASP